MRNQLILLLTASTLWLAPAVSRAAILYKVIDLGTLDGDQSTAASINSRGQVAGSITMDHYSVVGTVYTDNVTNHAFFDDGAMHDLGTLGGATSLGDGMNNSGAVVGQAYLADNSTSVAFLYSNGQMQDIGAGNGSVGYAINNNGVIVGNTGGTPQPFYYNGTIHHIGTLGGSLGWAYAVNDNGHITGQAQTSQGTFHAFLYNGAMHDLGTLGGNSAEGMAINANDQIAGYSQVSGGSRHAFFYDGVMHDIGALTVGSSSYSEAFGINDHDQIVGLSELANGGDVAFIYDSKNGMVNLNTLIDPSLGASLESATGINDSGQIAATAIINSAAHAVLLQPVPEPPQLLLAVIGVLGVAGLRMRLFACRRPTG
jgi:probable HAF family extracellular repeat protein